MNITDTKKGKFAKNAFRKGITHKKSVQIAFHVKPVLLIPVRGSICH